MSGNIELSKEAPLDARRKVNTFAELFLEATWKDSNNKVWLYDGMTVEVGDRLGELWQLKSKTSYSRQEDWVKISGGIEEAPKDGNPYMRKNGAWNAYTQIEEVYTFVANINEGKISQDAYNGLKAAVKAGKLIAIKLVDIDGRWIVSLSTLLGDTINLLVYVGDSFQTMVIKSDLSVTETYKNFILRDNTARYEVTEDYNPAHKKYVDDSVNSVKNNVLLKNNTTAYTPTDDYHPSTKKYVDEQMLLLTISNAGHQELVSNQDTTGETAATKINTVFGSVDNFKSVVSQLMANKRLVIKITEIERFQPGVIHFYMNTDNGVYELSFDYNYSVLSSTGATLLSKRILIAINNNYGNFFIVRDIVTSDNLTTLTKKTKSEYDGIGTKDNSTMYAITE